MDPAQAARTSEADENELGEHAIANEGPPFSVGWAVDGFRLMNTAPVITIASVACDLAVRDPGSFVYRLPYSLHLTGQYEPLP